MPNQLSALTNSASFEQEPSFKHPHVQSTEMRIEEQPSAYAQVQPTTQQMLLPVHVSRTNSNVHTNRDSVSSIQMPSLAMT